MKPAADHTEHREYFVAAVDIESGITPISAVGGADAARLLVRRAGRPVDWITIPIAGDLIAEAEVERAIFEQQSNLWNTLLIERLHDERIRSNSPVSIIVCTRDRASELDGCLRALSVLEYSDVEIIVVDNCSRSGETREVAGRWNARYVREDRPGLDNARNRGIAESTHDLIAFTDDDVCVDPKWLNSAVRLFDDPAVGAVTGLIAPHLLDTKARQLFELAYGGMGKGTRPAVWSRDLLSDGQVIRSHEIGAGANMIFRRRALVEAQGFDPALDVGTPSHGAGDLDIFHRLLLLGWVIHYEPASLVWHRHRAGLDELARQLYDNGRAYGVHLIRRIRVGGVSRLAIVRVAAGWVLWLLGRFVRRIAGHEKMPLRFIRAELSGAISAPLAYYLTYRDSGAPRT